MYGGLSTAETSEPDLSTLTPDGSLPENVEASEVKTTSPALGALGWLKRAIHKNTNPITGPAERNWSVYGFIQNKSRNRLGNPKADMLVYLFTNLRIRDQINSEDPQYFDGGEVGEEEPELVEDDDNGDLLQVIESLAIARETEEMAKLTNYDE
ncbi:hypothetical protein K469DRAFT_697481 [Zopfia rhizophila CBS 207.26]|uniref:HAT C-terminal dimerisation domain-containing protein n=1 Tax=Zopfia rhizophila CBS 207.26 TaxID=1314779 RepID=A0A6A6DDP8_9PEZI|nr:hypothetical protein K469DRAFT_697481 [Zopfia rhizophila CBS 207.26]